MKVKTLLDILEGTSEDDEVRVFCEGDNPLESYSVVEIMFITRTKDGESNFVALAHN